MDQKKVIEVAKTLDEALELINAEFEAFHTMPGKRILDAIEIIKKAKADLVA